VQLTSATHPQLADRLDDLGFTLQQRFDVKGDIIDIERAIELHGNAVGLMDNANLNKPVLLSNLGLALKTRFLRLGNLEDLENAILNKQKAVDLTPDGHPDRPTCLSNLGNALQARFSRLGSLEDLENAILNNQKAVNLMPNGHPSKPIFLSNLGNALEIRSVQLGSSGDLENAILNKQRAVDLTPSGHPGKPGRLYNLGSALETRFDRFGSLEDLEIMLNAYSQAAKSPTGSPIVRFRAACAWAKHSGQHARSPLSAYSCAIDLLPRIAWLGLPLTDQHALLADVGGIVREAVSAAIKMEELETAVEWAEQGRSIVWQNMLGLRTPVGDLRAKHPRLADQLQNIAQQMEALTSYDVAGANVKSSKLAIEWENTVEEIRKLPGFESFLKAKRFSQLAPAACEGPVVILNVDNSRADALVLTADDSEEKHISVVNIPLTRFSYESSQKLCENLTGLLKSSGLRARGETRKTGRLFPGGSTGTTFQKILRILWLDVVKPVIDGLEYQVCHPNDV